MGEGRALLVRHGRWRGRDRPYMRQVLDHLRVAHPATFARLRLHETGRAPPPLDDTRGVLFWLADPLRELYPRCYAEARAIAGEGARRGLRMINPPDALSNSRKSRQSELWIAAGLPTPAASSFRTRQELHAIAEALAYPVVLRGDLLHAQRRMHVCRDPAELRAIPERALGLPGVATTFVDPRGGFREALGPESPFARFFHAKRAFVIDKTVCFHHLYFSRGPIVTTPSSTIAPFAGWRELVKQLPEDVRACADEDVRYWAHGDDHASMLARAAEVLGLGWCAFDYITRADGSAVLFECNPYPTLSTLRHAALPRRRRIADRYAGYWRILARAIDELAGVTHPEGPS